MNIERTGDIGNAYLFKTLTVNQQEYNNINVDLKLFAEQNEVDFICLEKEGEIKFIHLTDSDAIDFIEENGLVKTDNIADLGIGIYVVEVNNIDAVDNLKTFIVDSEDKEITIAEGYYNGKYTECIYGYQHEGYIIINEDNLEINFADIITIEDFLTEY